ncbi:MAG TPA: DUF4097 family beta strand repeat-containing protein [Bryobacteraceae bacterium]|jgi:DUF4097 and DUF4098 domain-containing protein YvlB|nr:DUF4097 family beta strand repeat-containing protein [Bryobacteraceae bacterium]
MKALKVLASLALATTAFGQMRDNQTKEMTCDNSGSGNRTRYCEIREQSTAAMGLLNVDAGRNGGAVVKGWSRNEVLVRTRVEGWADSDADARVMGSQVYVDTSGGRVQAQGPQSTTNAGWSVSFEIFVPQATSLTVKTVNGGITVSDVRGSLRFDATNGGINLRRLAGDVTGSTVNGSVNLDLMGKTWDGSQVSVTTRNGGVNISVPENYSAHFQTETLNGTLRSEFPLNVTGDVRSGNHDFSIGAGGPLIHVTTTNGGVKLKKV